MLFWHCRCPSEQLLTSTHKLLSLFCTERGTEMSNFLADLIICDAPQERREWPLAWFAFYFVQAYYIIFFQYCFSHTAHSGIGKSLFFQPHCLITIALCCMQARFFWGTIQASFAVLRFTNWMGRRKGKTFFLVNPRWTVKVLDMVKSSLLIGHSLRNECSGNFISNLLCSSARISQKISLKRCWRNKFVP